ncbi:uncharacterized protein LOC143815786 [Ranitomeya variabilis]|uniref:uncharacterized protein LOC143815786 n=1 Tax=Ranitomeya variabilis TaxID=490064 RepID=UPI0040565C04
MKVADEEEEYSDEKWLWRVKKTKNVFRPHKFGEVSRFPFLERIDEEDEEEGDDLYLIDIRTDDINKYIRLRSGCDVMIAWASEESLPPMRLRKTAWASVESINSEEEEGETVSDDKMEAKKEEEHSTVNIRLHSKWWIPKCFGKTSRNKVKTNSRSDSEEKVCRPSKVLTAFSCCFSFKTSE